MTILIKYPPVQEAAMRRKIWRKTSSIFQSMYLDFPSTISVFNQIAFYIFPAPQNAMRIMVFSISYSITSRKIPMVSIWSYCADF